MSTHMTRSMSLGHRQQAPCSLFAPKPLPLRASRCRQAPASRRGWVDDAAFYYYSGPQASSSKPGKAYKQQKASKHRGRVKSLVAEVQSLVARLDQGLVDPMAQPVNTGLSRSYSSSSTTSTTTTSTSSSSSSSSSESDSDGERQQRRLPAEAAATLDTSFFDRQQQQLLERIYAGSLAEPSSGNLATPDVAGAAAPAACGTSSGPAPNVLAAQPCTASNVISRSSPGIVERPPRGSSSVSVGRPAAVPAGRVEVCMGKACARKGAAALLADFQAAAAVPGAAGVHLQVVPCGKCMGKCKLAPNVKVATTGGRSVLHSGVTAASARAILQSDFVAEADLFDFV